MKIKILLLLISFIMPFSLLAQKKSFIRDYSYQASEADSKLTARAIASQQLKALLISEVGVFIQSETNLNKISNLQKETTTGKSKEILIENYTEKIQAISAGIVEMKIIDERWDGSTYYIKAEISIDTDDVNKKIDLILNNRQDIKDLEESKRRISAAQLEIQKLQEELLKSKNESLQNDYKKSVEKLNAEELFLKGKKAYSDKFYEIAIEHYKKAIEIDSKYTSAYNNLGLCYFEKEKYEEAILNYQKALELDPKDAGIWQNLGGVYASKENYEKAIYFLQKSIELDPNYADAYYNLALAYAQSDNLKQALRWFKKSNELDPNNVVTLEDLSMAYWDNNELNSAIKTAEKALKIDPNSAISYYIIGSINSYKGKQNVAIKYLEKSIELDPKNSDAFLNLASIYNAKGNRNQAINYAKKAARLGSKAAQDFLRQYGQSW